MGGNKIVGITILGLISIIISLFLYTEVIAKEINASDILTFEVTDTTLIQNIITEAEKEHPYPKVYSIKITDDSTRFIGSLEIITYPQDIISEYDIETYKEQGVAVEYRGRYPFSFVSVEKTQIGDKEVDIFVVDIEIRGMNVRFKWCILIHKTYLIRFITSGLTEEVFENNSKVLDDIIRSIKFASPAPK